jgi:hypothetical protein
MTPFEIDIPAQALDDLRRRLRETRWPKVLRDDAWEDRTSLRFARRLVEY